MITILESVMNLCTMLHPRELELSIQVIAVQEHQAIFEPYAKNGSTSPEVKRQVRRSLVGTKMLHGFPLERCQQVTSRNRDVWTGA